MQDATGADSAVAGWQAIGDRAPMGLAVTAGPEHRLEYTNSPFRQLTGLPDTDLRGRTVSEVLRHPRWAKLLDQVLATGSPARDAPVHAGRTEYRVSAWLRSVSDDNPGLVIEVTPAPTAAGHQRRDAELTREIREVNARLVRAAIREEELAERAQAASRAKSDFLAVVSHELRTPLTAVIGYTDLLQTGMGGLNDMGSAWVDRIRFSAWHLRQIVDDLISTALEDRGGESVLLETVTAESIARDGLKMVEPSAREKGLEIRTAIPDPERACQTDVRKVRQALLNLLCNAVKFTTQGFVELAVEHTADSVLYHVRDSGIGIAPENLERIFEPFVQLEATSTRRFGGCGLGLGLSRRYAHLLGGDITVTSRPACGSEFTLRIPVRTSARPPRASSTT